MKFVIETGTARHSTSSASVQAKFVGGEYDGCHLFEKKQFQVETEWDNSKTNERWVLTVYELPAGTEIAVIGKGRTGPRGVYKYDFHCIYKLDESADVQEIYVDCGLHNCLLKGRFVLVRDLLAKQAKIDTERGF